MAMTTKQRTGAMPQATRLKSQPAAPEPKPANEDVRVEPQAPKMLYREWIFQSHHPGLIQCLLPSKRDQAGNMLEEQFEADFGGDTGREGMWRINDGFSITRMDSENPVTAKELVAIMRAKMKMKPHADMNIVELTQDKENGDPVYEAVDEEELQPR
jgi:hypothetical protein